MELLYLIGEELREVMYYTIRLERGKTRREGERGGFIVYNMYLFYDAVGRDISLDRSHGNGSRKSKRAFGTLLYFWVM